MTDTLVLLIDPISKVSRENEKVDFLEAKIGIGLHSELEGKDEQSQILTGVSIN